MKKILTALVLSAMILSFTACSPDIKDDTVLSSSSSALDVDDMSADAAYQEAEPEILKVLNLIGAEDEPLVLSSTLEDEISRIYLCVDCIVDGKPLFIIASTLKYADQTDWSVNSVSKVEEEGLRHYYSIIASDSIYDFRTDELISGVDEFVSEEPEDTTLAFDTPFSFDGFEVTLGSGIEWTMVDNEFSEYYGADVIKVPITIVNNNSETTRFNSFYYTFFGSKGVELDIVSAYFDDDVSDIGELRPGATSSAYMHILYDGDGDYYISFDNYSEELEIKLPIAK